MATLTPVQFQQKLNDKLRSLKVAETIVYPVATATLDKLRQRLFQKGIEGDGSSTGTYSTASMYASKEQFKETGAFRAQGKSESRLGQKRKTTTVYDISSRKKKSVAVKKNNTERKSMYLPNGYKELRQIQGMETAFVNLQYSGDLFQDFTKLSVEGDKVVVKVSREINKKKIEGLTKKYGPSTFKHSKEEREFFNKEVQKRLVNYLNS